MEFMRLLIAILLFSLSVPGAVQNILNEPLHLKLKKKADQMYMMHRWVRVSFSENRPGCRNILETYQEKFPPLSGNKLP
jgi:hypothetical protein